MQSSRERKRRSVRKGHGRQMMREELFSYVKEEYAREPEGDSESGTETNLESKLNLEAALPAAAFMMCSHQKHLGTAINNITPD